MNFFKFYIGDYQRDTAHLSITEHGAYQLMLQHYYATEKPLPEGKALHRMLRAQGKAERDAIDSVVQKFWTSTAAGLVNDRADAEITKAGAQAETNGRIAREREARRKEPQEQHEDSTNRATNTPPNQTPDTRHQRKEKKKETPRKRGAAGPRVSLDDLVGEGVDPQHAGDWLTARRAKDLPLTPTAWQQTKAEAAKAGLPIAEAIRLAAANGWAGLRAHWVHSEGRSRAPPLAFQTARQRDAADAAARVHEMTGGLLDATRDPYDTIDMEPTHETSRLESR